MKEISLIKAVLSEEDINTFVLIQNSVYHPKTFKMGGVTRQKAIDRFQDAEVLFIKEGSDTIGTLEYEFGAGDYVYIKSIAIIPEFQSMGIGRQALLLLFNNELKFISKIGLNTHPENKALGLYQSMDFVIEKEIPGNRIMGYEPSLFLTFKRHF